MTHDEPNLNDVLISLIRSKRAGCETTALAADVIAANARLNHRILKFKHKSTHSEEKWLEILDFCDELYERCKAAIGVFDAGGDHETLHRALTQARDELNAAMK